MIKDRLEKLRELMAERHIDAYLIPTADYHESEYVGDYFKCREYITGFTGSAGTAVVTADQACLWTDGRYFVQAAKELEGTGITLQKMDQEGVPCIEDYLQQVIPEGGVLGFDGRVINYELGEKLEDLISQKQAVITYHEDLEGMIWTERPGLSKESVWILDEKYAGVSAQKKIEHLREAMAAADATVHILTNLDDIVWLFNIRGNDVPCNPVVLSYVIITDEKIYLFIQEEVLDGRVKAYLADLGVTLEPYHDINDFVTSFRQESVLLETGQVSYALYNNLDDSNLIINQMNPTVLAKAVKNETELDNMRKAHIKDGVAVTKFIYWLKKNIGKMPIDEISAADYLESLRKEQDGYLGPSFATISAYRENAAMCHYKASKQSNKILEPSGLYLVDSGGQYYEGTTDITRTIALGELGEQEKEHFTLVALCMLRLGYTRFLYGCRGLNLDFAARGPLWARGLNFDHGTGHGVGYLLNVHERPNGIRWKIVPERQDSGVLEDGMVTSDEPGIYIEGSHGIRTENLIVCRKDMKNQFGQFMKFEFLTFVPIDLDAIDKNVLEPKDVDMLNEYHEQVYDKISPYLTDEEAEWLKEYTRKI